MNFPITFTATVGGTQGPSQAPAPAATVDALNNFFDAFRMGMDYGSAARSDVGQMYEGTASVMEGYEDNLATTVTAVDERADLTKNSGDAQRLADQTAEELRAAGKGHENLLQAANSDYQPAARFSQEAVQGDFGIVAKAISEGENALLQIVS